MDEPQVVTYETESEFAPPIPQVAHGGLAGLALKRGWAKSSAEAEKLLLWTAIAAVCVAIVVWFFFLRADRSGQAEQGSLEPITVTAGQ